MRYGSGCRNASLRPGAGGDGLECFVSLASTLNYTKTAEQVCLTQPAVTKQIQSLEDELGNRLFVRTTRSVSLSRVGAQFLPEATNMLNAYYHAKEWMSNFHNQVHRVLKIGYSDPLATLIIGETLEYMHRRDLNPSLVYAQTDTNLSQLAQGQVDVLIGMKDVKFTSDSIGFKKLIRDQFYCLLRKDHPLAAIHTKSGDRVVHSDELWSYRQIVEIPPYLMRNYFSRGAYIVQVNENLDNVLCSNVSEAYGLVLAGLGFAFVPGHLVMPHPDICILPWAESSSAPFGVYYRSQDLKDRDSLTHAFLKASEYWRPYLDSSADK